MPDNLPCATPACHYQPPPNEPTAELGILLVHGIGDHREGETLTAFGEPLLDWMRQWLRGNRAQQGRGDLSVPEARLKADGAPAYVVAQVTVPSGDEGKDGSVRGPPPHERWLLCEGWWGGSVQPPRSWNLLLWLWNRGPLIVYWHYYLIGVARGYTMDKGPLPLLLIVPAVFIASFFQFATTIAMLLWLVPIGPWRRGVLAVVQTVTLTLGDSFVLLEQEIQHAALVERIRRSLNWLADRTSRIIVVAHSQGGAIAHEVLMRDSPRKVTGFISIGSGLEKLQFLQAVARSRRGTISAALVLPLGLITVTVAMIAWGAEGQVWQKGLATFAAIVLLVNASVLYAALKNYLGEASSGIVALKLPDQLGDIQWLDLYASHDAVPMCQGSLLREAKYVKQQAVCNECSRMYDHISYFRNYNDCLHRIWSAIAIHSQLRLFRSGDEGRLERFARVHGQYARVVSLSRISCSLAAFIIGFVLRNELVSFGQSVLASIQGTAAEQWLAPVKDLAAGIAWLVDRWWRPGVASADTLTQALFGLALLLGAIIGWWALFRGFWQWRCKMRCQAVARGDDLSPTLDLRIARTISLGLFALLGSLPLIVAVVLYYRPDVMTFDSIGRLLAGTLSVIAVGFALIYATGGPWLAAMNWQKDQTSPGGRLGHTMIMAGISLVLLLAARALWPTELDPSVLDLLAAIAFSAMAISWQIYAVLIHRKTLGRFRTWLIGLFPLASAAVVTFSGGSIDVAILVYVGITAMLIATAFSWHHRQHWIEWVKKSFRFVKGPTENQGSEDL